MKTAWLVVRIWAGGKREVAFASFKECDARRSAGLWCGKDGALVTLETIDIAGGESVEYAKVEQKDE